MSTRVQKILAHLGQGSRRACEKLIADGRVTLNGRMVELGDCVEEHDIPQLQVDGVSVGRLPDKRYLLLNKPRGHVTTVSDPQNRDTVMSLLPAGSIVGPGRLFPVGRLDLNTEGALLFTNDGDLANGLLHPSSGVEKEYYAKVDSRVNERHLGGLRAGPTLDDGPTQPPKYVRGKGREIWMVLKEGRKRQVRRMLEAVGLKCLYLERSRFANLTLDHLERGEYRELCGQELADLRALARESTP